MFACCHFGSSIDAAGACGKNRRATSIRKLIVLSASAHPKSGGCIGRAMGKRPGQAAVLKRPAAKMCCPAKNAAEFASGHTTNRSPVDETEGAASGNASSSMESSPSTDANAQGLATGNDSSASAIAELSALNLQDLRKEARKRGVLVKDAGKKWRTRSEIEEDCRRAMNRSLVQETEDAAPGNAGATAWSRVRQRTLTRKVLNLATIVQATPPQSCRL